MGEKISFEDAHSMYTNSVVSYKGAPVYVMGVEPNMNTLILDLESGALQKVQFDLDYFENITSRLGYINFGPFCMYMRREPRRRYKVGLSRENITLVSGDFDYQASEMAHVQTMRDGLTVPHLVDTLAGRYPSFEEIHKVLTSGASRIMAFDRQFAVSATGKVYYRANHVGEVDLGKYNTMDKIKFVTAYEPLMKVLGGKFSFGA